MIGEVYDESNGRSYPVKARYVNDDYWIAVLQLPSLDYRYMTKQGFWVANHDQALRFINTTDLKGFFERYARKEIKE